MHLQKKNIGVDEELGKKDDDHRRSRNGRLAMTSPATSTFPWRGPRRKRFALAFILLLVIYFFIKNIPHDGPITRGRHPFKPRPPSGISSETRQWEDAAPKDTPPRPENPEKDQHYFEGPIRYFNLAASFGMGFGSGWGNRNVLFAVSNLKSAASLLPLACDMSKQKRNKVHLVLLGRDPLSAEEIVRVNGLSKADCAVLWHDGRPDYSQFSTDRRMELSVRAAFKHLEAVLKPRVVIVDSAVREDSFFSEAIKIKSAELGVRLMELPLNAAEKLQWISKLDSHSLSAWNNVGVEILVHASSEASGSLIRLLKSLETAEYFGFPMPRITIELPTDVDPPTLHFLSGYRWPPHSQSGDSRLTVRHRLSASADGDQALRQIESFYPPNGNSHLVVLSSQVELSPLYFHYLIFTLLEYKYSATAYHASDFLCGISLEQPSTLLDNQTPLQPPKTDTQSNLFLYQAPSSNAALYFGDKWTDLHAFMARRLASPHAQSTQQSNRDFSYPIGPNQPPWLEYMLELTRLRGWSMLYPSSSGLETALATVPNTKPPPFSSPSFPSSLSTASQAPAIPTNTILSAPYSPPVPQLPLSLLSPRRSILHILTPDLSPSTPASDSGPTLPDLPNLPFLSYKGEHLEQGRVAMNQLALVYSEEFRRVVGGCTETKKEEEKGTGTGTGEKANAEEEDWLDSFFCHEPSESSESSESSIPGDGGIVV